MSVEIGQDISTLLGNTGSYVSGNPNSLMAQTFVAGLGQGFSTDQPATTAGAFNKSAAGVEKTAGLALKAPAPAVTAQFSI